jgi:hypothetical protein
MKKGNPFSISELIISSRNTGALQTMSSVRCCGSGAMRCGWVGGWVVQKRDLLGARLVQDAAKKLHRHVRAILSSSRSVVEVSDILVSLMMRHSMALSDCVQCAPPIPLYISQSIFLT